MRPGLEDRPPRGESILKQTQRRMNMRRGIKKIGICLCLSTFLLFSIVVTVSGEEYKALHGLESIKAVFDVRTGSAKSAAGLLKLIDETFKDKNITTVSDKPVFVVVFIGPAVKLVSKEREGFSTEDKKILNDIADTIKTMSKEGIKFEICMVAANVFNVKASSILLEIKQVHNGWISLIGYQAKGYSLVPVY